MDKHIAVLEGDGIGPEIVREGRRILDTIAEIYGHNFFYTDALVGGAAYDAHGHPLPDETKEACSNADAIYFGAVGGPKWENLPPELTPERGALLPLRKEYDLFANLRPAIIFGPLSKAASLKEDRLEGGLDLMIVRELTSGIYFGKRSKGSDWASDEMRYSVPEIERIAKVASEIAMKRDRKLTSVDKSNVLDVSKLWRSVVTDYVKNNYPEISLNHLYVDNAAMQLGTYPKQFDVIVTGNMFGDILSDLASAITGSIGMLPSASLNETGFGLYEPVHGSAPDIAGKGCANPLAQILSGSMMLRYSFGMAKEADAIDRAVLEVLEDGFRTPDIAKSRHDAIGTVEMGKKVAEYIKRNK